MGTILGIFEKNWATFYSKIWSHWAEAESVTMKLGENFVIFKVSHLMLRNFYEFNILILAKFSLFSIFCSFSQFSYKFIVKIHIFKHFCCFLNFD